jgi:hypothetical protein
MLSHAVARSARVAGIRALSASAPVSGLGHVFGSEAKVSVAMMQVRFLEAAVPARLQVGRKQAGVTKAGCCALLRSISTSRYFPAQQR